MNFTGWEKTFNQSVPILCFDGHEPYADHHITCLENGTWGGHAMCVLKGRHHVFVYEMSLVVRKPVFGVSDQVRHKPGCTATEVG